MSLYSKLIGLDCINPEDIVSDFGKSLTCTSPRMLHRSPVSAMGTGLVDWRVLGAGEAPLNRADTLNINGLSLVKNAQLQKHTHLL